MKKSFLIMSIFLGLIFITLLADTVRAEDFSFIGINWSDSPQEVIEKINTSGYSAFSIDYDESKKVPAKIVDIFPTRYVDLERYNSFWNYTYPNMKFQEMVSLNKISMTGKNQSIVNKANFFFTKENSLLSYDIFLNSNVVKVNEDTGKCEFYDNLVKKYGKPKKSTKHSKIWNANGQTLYYTNTSQFVWLTYINEKILDAHIKQMDQLKASFETEKNDKQSGAVKKYF